MKKQLLTILCTIILNSAFAQNLSLNVAATPAQIVTQLTDPSITVSNIVQNCPATTARGLFTNTGSPLLIPSGVIFTTGLAATVGTANTDACLPPVLGSNASASTNNANGSADTDLATLAGTGINDVCTIAFDMVAPTDSLAITYEFGSEEYQGFSDPATSFNDVFGFFISGPGITVPAGYTGRNIALVPGTASYVGIKTINQTVNNQYYVNNCSTTPVAGITCTLRPSTSIEYNGYSKVLVAKVKLQAGQTYRVKLGIADATDGIYDTGVFIKAQSIQPIALPIELIDFAAQRDNTSGTRRNKVTWTTAMERNNSHFELLRRTDDAPFQVVAKIGGHGFSSVPQAYEFEDNQLGDGTNYYMLRQVDFDGKNALSKVISIENRESIQVHDAYPNPVGDAFNTVVEMPSDMKDVKAEILDITGRIIRVHSLNIQPGTNNISINTDDLQTGMYFFRIISGDTVSRMQRIVK